MNNETPGRCDVPMPGATGARREEPCEEMPTLDRLQTTWADRLYGSSSFGGTPLPLVATD
jgi:hypothetical protein